MKKMTISFAFDEEKVSATKMFLEQKKVDLEAELAGFMEGLYKKHVPAGVRDYIEMMDGLASKEKEKKKTSKPAPPASAPAPDAHGSQGDGA